MESAAPLLDLLRARRTEIADRWIDAALSVYPAETAGVFRRNTDEFRNPVGHRTSQACHALLDMLLTGGVDLDAARTALDEMLRIRAVQDLAPSQAVGFVFLLKPVVRAMAEEHGRSDALRRELAQFESAVDTLALAAFDGYAACREAVAHLRASELRARHFLLLKRAGMLCDLPEPSPSATD